MKKQYERKSRGFTIVETLIVLAIVGVMMVVVFLAVPALQRNSRNTQAKTEGNNIVAAVNEFISNSGGKLPSTTTDATNVLASSNVKNITSLTIAGQSGATAITSTSATVVTAAKCTAAVTSGGLKAPSAVTTAGAARQFAVIYPMEDRAGDATGCIDS